MKRMNGYDFFSVLLLTLTFLGCSTHRSPTYEGLGNYRGHLSQTETELSGIDIEFQWPVRDVRITQFFAPKKNRKHRGVDLAGNRRTPILAAHEGRVVYAGRAFRGYGKMVLIEFDGQWASLYAHLSRIHVRQGQLVSRGQKLGLMGRTGRATGVHLHFEVMEFKQNIDPLKVLPEGDRLAFQRR